MTRGPRDGCRTGARRLTYLILVLIAVSVPGCGRNDNSRSGVAGRTVITVWHPWGGPTKERFEALVAEFNKAHPDILIKPLFAPNDLGSNQKFFTAVVANKAPDVIFVDGPQTAAWAEQGALQPLDRFIKRTGIKPSDFFAPCWAQNYYRGHTWALTFCADPNFGFAWNKKAFREAGLDPEKPPRTIEELDRYSDAITKFQNGNITRMAFIPWAQFGGANSVFTWGWAFGGSFYDPARKKITADDPKVVKAMEWMMSYSKKYDVRKINAFASGFGSREQNPFYTGQIAMTCLHIFQLQDIKQYAPNLDYGITYIPAPRGGEQHSSWVGGWCLALPKGSKHAKLGWEFIRWCCRDPKGTSAVGRLTGLFPGYKDSPFLKSVEGKPGYAEFLRILKECRHQRPVMPAQTFYMTALDRAVDYCVFGRLTPKQALENATRDTQAELDLRLAGR
jgi:multiple sugar transport system substrate-binding protein